VGDDGAFGSSVALEGDLLVVGANQDPSVFDPSPPAPVPPPARNGLVRIFERDRGGADNWGEVTTLTHTAVGDADHPRYFGGAVAIEGDLLLVGASRTSLGLNTTDGAAISFAAARQTRTAGTISAGWSGPAQMTAPGVARCRSSTSKPATRKSRPRRNARGRACSKAAISVIGWRSTGDTLVVSAPLASGFRGQAYVYRRDPGGADVWPYVATLAPSASGGLGRDLALAGDTVLTGSGDGAAYLFERAAGGPNAWGQVAELTAHDDRWGGTYSFGSAVALDGAARIIGFPGDSENRGAVYIVEAPDEPPDVPPFVATGTLTDGGVVGATEGALLGAPAGALAAPVDVAIKVTDPPEDPFAELEPVGDHVLVAAETAVLAPADKPFLIGLPLPEGHDGSNLAAAVLVAADRVIGGPESGAVWSLTTGSLDAASGLYVVPLSALDPDPTIVVLVDAPAEEPDADTFRASAQLTADGYDFFLRCVSLNNFPGCSASRQLIHDAFVAAYDDFVIGQGYPRPYLNAWEGSFAGVPTMPDRPETPVPYVNGGTVLGTIQITPEEEPCSNMGVRQEAGSYNPADFNITICVDRRTGGVDRTSPQPKLLDKVVATIRHELFHAIQHSYVNVRAADRLGDRLWTLDGTAASVQNPAGTLTRALKYPLRRIDRSLVDEQDYLEYQTQDFWIYFGREQSLAIAYFKGMFENGVDTYAADLLFANQYQTSLGLEYWAWAKNQVMEKSFDFDDRLFQPCHIEAQVIEDVKVLWYDFTEFPVFEPTLGGDLERLTSAVVQIEVVGATGPIRVSVDHVPNLRYKVYLDGEDADVDGKPACVSAVEDAPRTFNQAPDQPVYVLVSNVLHPPGSTLHYTVRVEPAPSGDRSNTE
jgi:hypothetical protein